MKTKTLLAIGLCAAIGILGAPKTLAQEHKGGTEHAGGHEKIKIPDTVEGIWKEIHKHQDELKAIVKGKKLDEVHPLAFAIRDLAKALPAKTKSGMKKMVESGVKRVSQLAEELDKSGDAGDQAKTEANVKKMDAALKTLEEHASM